MLSEPPPPKRHVVDEHDKRDVRLDLKYAEVEEVVFKRDVGVGPITRDEDRRRYTVVEAEHVAADDVVSAGERDLAAVPDAGVEPHGGVLADGFHRRCGRWRRAGGPATGRFKNGRVSSVAVGTVTGLRSNSISARAVSVPSDFDHAVVGERILRLGLGTGMLSGSV